MKKSNVVAVIITVIVSIFLLWLWFYLGFNHIDNPLDLVLSIIWWVIIAIAIFAVSRVEKRRKQHKRTSYIGANYLYNPESGIVNVEPDSTMIDTLNETLDDMKYNFKTKDIPDDMDPKFTWIVRSAKFKKDGDEWEGEVVSTAHPDDEPIEFEDREQLEQILTGKYRPQAQTA